MKTNLPKEIKTVEQAKVFLTELYKNGEAYHPEDDATDIVWNLPEQQHPTHAEAVQMNKLMQDIYNLPGNKDKYPNLEFDPCEVIMDLWQATNAKVLKDKGYRPHPQKQAKNRRQRKGQSSNIMEVEIYGEVD